MCLLPKDDQDEKCVEKYALLFVVPQLVCLVVQISCHKFLFLFQKLANIWKIFLCLKYRAKAPDYFRNLTYFH